MPYGPGCPAAAPLGKKDVLLFGGIMEEGEEGFSGDTLVCEPRRVREPARSRPPNAPRDASPRIRAPYG